MILFDRLNIKNKTQILSGSIKFLLFFAVLSVLLSACDPNMDYEKNVAINTNGWNSDEPAEFEVEVSDTISPHNFYINLRHTTEYKYSNIYLFLDTYFPGESKTRDTIEIILADITGKWFGKGMGKILENQVLLQKNFVFPLQGNYKFNIEQGMREQELEGVADVGIRIERSQE